MPKITLNFVKKHLDELNLNSAKWR